MAKFNFRLEKLLEYRRLQEKWAKDAYLEALGRRNEIEGQIEAAKRRKSTAMATHPAGLDELISLDAYFTRLDDEKRALESALAVVADEADVYLQEFQVAKRETAAIEKLRETALAEWNLEQSRKEQAVLDEWATQRRAA